MEIEGDVLDLSMGGCGAISRGSEASDLRIGDRVLLDFQALLLTEPLRVEGTVRRIEEGADGSEIGFELDSPEAVSTQVPYVLMREFNRRGAERASVERAEVSVRIGPDGSWLPALLCDLSTTGMGLVPSAELRFRLTDSEHLFELAGRLCSMRNEAPSTVFGVEFVPGDSVDFATQQAALRAHVARREARPVSSSYGDTP